MSAETPMTITRELLEQYLTVHRASPEMRALIEVEFARHATPVQAVARVLDPEELFLLSLCACAERCLTHAAELGRANVAVGHGVLLSQAAEFLNAAGIELVAWERARHKGGG